MANRSKSKGDRAELEVQGILRDLLGVPARRMLGAGRLDDVGDIDGVPNTTISVANWADLNRAIREKLGPLDQQRERAGSLFAAMFARRVGGGYVVCMTVDQFATLWREAQPGKPATRAEATDPNLAAFLRIKFPKTPDKAYRPF